MKALNETDYAMKKTRFAALIALTIVTSLVLARPICAEELPFEVKFLLDEGLVLDENNDLSPTYQELFKTGEDYVSGTLMYLETPERTFNDEGWVNRLRWRSDKERPQLTCKKRYAVPGDDLDASIAEAMVDGLDVNDEDDDYDPEVDWSYDKMTLGFTSDTKISLPEGTNGIADLNLADAIKIVSDNMPEDEADWDGDGWGLKAIMNARIVGPLVYKRYTGTFNGEDVHVEVWPSPTADGGMDYIAELSFDSDSLADAQAVRPSMQTSLDDEGVLVAQSGLKTNAILDAYLGRKGTDGAQDEQKAEADERQDNGKGNNGHGKGNNGNHGKGNNGNGNHGNGNNGNNGNGNNGNGNNGNGNNGNGNNGNHGNGNNGNHGNGNNGNHGNGNRGNGKGNNGNGNGKHGHNAQCISNKPLPQTADAANPRTAACTVAAGTACTLAGVRVRRDS